MRCVDDCAADDGGKKIGSNKTCVTDCNDCTNKLNKILNNLNF